MTRLPRGETIAKALCARFGSGDFDYAGNGHIDLPVWRTARRSIIVAPSPRLLENHIWNSQTADVLCPDDRVTGRYVDALHPGRWIKNLLIFIPLFDVANRNSAHFVVSAYLAFCAYCLVASAAYVANDLIDLRADRKHIVKHRRVFASGRISIPRGILLFFGLSLAGTGLGSFSVAAPGRVAGGVSGALAQLFAVDQKDVDRRHLRAYRADDASGFGGFHHRGERADLLAPAVHRLSLLWPGHADPLWRTQGQPVFRVPAGEPGQRLSAGRSRHSGQFRPCRRIHVGAGPGAVCPDPRGPCRVPLAASALDPVPGAALLDRTDMGLCAPRPGSRGPHPVRDPGSGQRLCGAGVRGDILPGRFAALPIYPVI